MSIHTEEFKLSVMSLERGGTSLVHRWGLGALQVRLQGMNHNKCYCCKQNDITKYTCWTTTPLHRCCYSNLSDCLIMWPSLKSSTATGHLLKKNTIKKCGHSAPPRNWIWKAISFEPNFSAASTQPIISNLFSSFFSKNRKEIRII